METKQCTKCKTEKPQTLEFFGSKKSSPTGLHNWCRLCKTEYDKAYSKTDKGILSLKKSNTKYFKSSKGKDTLKTYYKNKGKDTLKKYVYSLGSGIYQIIDELNQCLYVGQSKRLQGRINFHKTYINNPLSAPKDIFDLYNNISKHFNVNIRIIEECPTKILLEREQHYIDVKKPLYNTLKK